MSKAVYIILIIILCVLLWFYFKPSDETVPELAQTQDNITENIQSIDRSTSVATPSYDVNDSTPVAESSENLDNSDEIVTTFIDQQASGILPWLASDELIRRFVINVNAIAEGNLPSDFRLVNKKLAPFSASASKYNDRFYIDDTTYRRLTPLIKMVTQIPVENLTQFYTSNYGLFQKAYSELGLEGQFNDKFILAIDRVVGCPLPNKKLLKHETVAYKYVDNNYEKAKPLKKALWRMGNNNMQAIQNYSQEIKVLISRPMNNS